MYTIHKQQTNMNFYLAQFLTGRGCYRAYLYKDGDNIDEARPECRNDSETAKHNFFTCPRYVA